MRKITVKIPVTFIINADDEVTMSDIMASLGERIDAVSGGAGWDIEDADIGHDYEVLDSR
jgi:hypothetical protein